MARFRSMAIAALAASALFMTPTAAYAHTGHNHAVTNDNTEDFKMHWASYNGELTDLRPTTTEPLDGARATAAMVGLNTSRFTLLVTGIDKSAAGRTFGAHLHLGPCLEGDYSGAVGLAHYNTDVLAKVIPPDISPQTEAWLDFKANSIGIGSIRVSAPFVPQPGERSIVIHANPTARDGKAGDRLACLPLNIKRIGS